MKTTTSQYVLDRRANPNLMDGNDIARWMKALEKRERKKNKKQVRRKDEKTS